MGLGAVGLRHGPHRHPLVLDGSGCVAKPLHDRWRHADTATAGCPRVFHSDTSTTPPMRPKVMVNEITVGILPMMPNRKILQPMNTSAGRTSGR